MTILYDVTARGKHIAVVGSKEPILSGQYFLEENAHTVPDWDAVKSALPHYWRKAFDRALKWNVDGTNQAYCSLRDLRGRFLATVNCAGYVFKGYTKKEGN